MAAIIELKYFNSFWLKKMRTITEVKPTSVSGEVVTVSAYNQISQGPTITVFPAQSPDLMNVGQETTIEWTDAGVPVVWRSSIVSRNLAGTEFILASIPPSPACTLHLTWRK